ncbi:heparinase II/III family protein [Kluyvera sp. CRP]|uniref:heparinase II/III domain-containing protein n=1 Tax=Kluyvera sp. CRP TaxID=2873269 RepID=UPI001CC21AA3|nr:heparinase II/III family protein [Kluyvera sp. CRP]UAK19448.1 heparinase II/III-family protein [Kluyvera sp. CRP]
MKQFSGLWSDIARRAAGNSGLIERLIKDAQPALNAEVRIPQSGIATWNLYYFCPHHGVRLIWQPDSPHRHCCPVDGEAFRGEPWDGAWWREMNGRNASACQQLGLLWQLTGEKAYRDKVRTLLMGYADVYPGYEIHGGIPHNGPGKMNAQTLCEANCILDMALGYDFIQHSLTDDERQHISRNLLRCAATFLQAHRSPQIHNHEVKISAALGVLGFVLEDEDLLEFAVNAPYGLRWQLEHGLLAEGLWFEGSVHYHYYALQGFFAFEKLARGTRWSLLDGPWYPQMLSFPLSLLLPDGTFPRLNDCIAGQEKLHHRDLYEFAWFIWRDPQYAAVLHFTEAQPDERETLLWRDSPLPETTPDLIPQQSLFAPGAGLTLWRRPQQQQAVLIKHSPWGGEHDHYDRLSLMLWQRDGWLLPDLGTTGYGAKMHYDYYKNSATHNTLTVNQTNQPPANAAVLGWHMGDDYLWLDTEVDWGQPPPQLNSHTRVEWDEEAWREVRFRRRLLWLDDVLIDLSMVDNPHRQQLDWTLHLAAQALDQSGTPMPFSLSGPLRHMTESTMTPLHGCQPRHFAREGDTVALWLAGDGELWQGLAPDNPAVSDLSYLVMRNHLPQARFVCLWDLATKSPLTEVSVHHTAIGTQLSFWRGERVAHVTLYDDPALPPDILL